MGCGFSSGIRRSSRSKRDDLGEEVDGARVSIHHGCRVRLLDAATKVVFIFGGPGSKKGAIVNELMYAFGFTLVNVEKIILQQLTKHLENQQDPSDCSAAVKGLLKDQPELVSWDWVIQEIILLMNKDPERCYLIDILPNLKVLLRLDSFLKNFSCEMKDFESEYPVSFALNLECQASTFVKKSSDAGSSKNKRNSSNNAQTDEADSTRTEKRVSLYNTAVKPILEYFSKSERLVSVDVSSGKNNLIWTSLCDFLDSLELPHVKAVNTVIYFAFDSQESNSIKDLYHVEYVCLKDQTENPQDTPEKLICSLCQYIDKRQLSTQTFLVELTGTSLTDNSIIIPARKPVMFLDVDNCLLRKHMALRTHDNTEHSKDIKVVASTENQVYLFPRETQTELCKKIAGCMTQCREDP